MTSHPTLFVAPTRIGDAVLAASLLEHIRTTRPEARVTIVTSALAAPLYQGFPLLECLITITKRSYNRHWFGAWRNTFGTRWEEIWDVRNSILSYTLRGKMRHCFTKAPVEEPKVKQYERVLETGPLPYPTLWARPEDGAAAAALMPGDARHLVFAPIANWAPKEWPMAHYIALAQTLLSGPCAGYRPVIVCAAHEREKARPMLEALAPHHPVDLTTGAHLLTVYAAMQRAHGFIGNDSGLMHIAAAAGIPTLGLFGPTPSAVYQPWGKRASFLDAPEKNLGQLMPEVVAERFTTML